MIPYRTLPAKSAKAAALLTAGSLFLNLSFPPALCASFWAERRKAAAGLKNPGAVHKITASACGADPLSGLDLPEDLGILIESASPGSSPRALPLIIHIQDAHGVYAGQKNLSAILQLIKSRNFPDRPMPIFVEGAWREVDTGAVSAFLNGNSMEESAGRLLKEGKITGEEHFSIVHPGDAQIHGVEDETLYRANLSARDLSLNAVHKRAAAAQAQKEEISRVKSRLFSKELLELERLREAYLQQKADLLHYLSALWREAPELSDDADLKALREFRDASEMEKKVSMREAETEQKLLLTAVGGKCGRTCVPEILRLAVDYRLGRVSALTYFGNILAMCRAHDFSAPGLQILYDFLGRSRRADYTGIEQELHRLQAAAFSNLVEKSCPQTAHEEIRKALERSEDLEMELKFLEHKMSPREWSVYRQKALPAREARARFLGESYFELALKRDRVMTENMLKALAGSRLRAAVLIAGGFHTEGIIQRLKARAFPYVVIRPSLHGAFGAEAGQNLRSPSIFMRPDAAERLIPSAREAASKNGKGVYSTEELLEKWRSILEGSRGLSWTEVVTVLNIALTVVNHTTLSRGVIGERLDGVSEAVQGMHHLALETIQRLKAQIQEGNLDPQRAKDMDFACRELIKFARYAPTYRHGLEYLNLFKQNLGYLFNVNTSNFSLPPRTLVRIIKGLAFPIRVLWGFERAMVWSSGQFLNHWFPKILQESRALDDGLYPDPEELKAQMLGAFDGLKGKRIEFVSASVWVFRKYVSRLAPVLIVPGVYLMLGLPITFLSMVLGLLISAALSWIFIVTGILAAHVRYRWDMRRLRKLERDLGEPLGAESWIAVEYERSLQALRDEMSGAASADLLIVLSDGDPADRRAIERALEDSRGSFVGREVPAVVLPMDGEMNGAGELEVAHFLLSEAFPRLQDRHPHLRMEVDRMRIGVVSVCGVEGQGPVLAPLQLPHFEQSVSLFQFAFPSAYKGTQALMKAKEGGIVFIHANEPAITPVDLQGDITLFTDWLSFEEMRRDRLDAVLTDINGAHAVRKMYIHDGSLGLDMIANKFERRYLESRGLDVENLDKRQVQTPLNGMIVRFRTPEKCAAFLETADEATNFIAGRTQKFPLVTRKHILLPLVLGSNGENLFTSLAAQDGDEGLPFPLRPDWNFYASIHYLIGRQAGRLEVSATVPYPSQSSYYFGIDERGSHSTDREDVERLWRDVTGAPAIQKKEERGPAETFRPRAARALVSLCLSLSSVPILRNLSIPYLRWISSQPDFLSSFPMDTRTAVAENLLQSRALFTPEDELRPLFARIAGGFFDPADEIRKPRYLVINLKGLTSRDRKEWYSALELILETLIYDGLADFQAAEGGAALILNEPEGELLALARELGIPPHLIKIIAKHPSEASKAVFERDGRVTGFVCSRESSVLKQMKEQFGPVNAVLIFPFARLAMNQDLTVQGPAAERIFRALQEQDLLSEGVLFLPADDPSKCRLVFKGRRLKAEFFGEKRGLSFHRILLRQA